MADAAAKLGCYREAGGCLERRPYVLTVAMSMQNERDIVRPIRWSPFTPSSREMEAVA